MNPLSTKSFGEEEPQDEAPLVNPSELEDWIIYEDESVVAINKPGWLVCHPSKNGPWSSLVGAVRERLQLEQVYLAGRLDRETSGVVLLAKNESTGRHWQKALVLRFIKIIVQKFLKSCLDAGQVDFVLYQSTANYIRSKLNISLKTVMQVSVLFLAID